MQSQSKARSQYVGSVNLRALQCQIAVIGATSVDVFKSDCTTEGKAEKLYSLVTFFLHSKLFPRNSRLPKKFAAVLPRSPLSSFPFSMVRR